MQDGVATVRTSVLRRRPVAALLAAEVLSTTGSQMTWLALPWFVLIATGSAKQMTLVIAAEAAGYALFGIPSGTLLERLGPQRTMRLCDAVRAPLMLLVPVLHWSGDLSLPLLLVLTFLVGVASTPYAAAQRVVVAEILDEDEASVERANALLQGATRITMLCGPALAGILIAAVGAPIVLVVDAATYIVSFALVTLFVPVTRVVPKRRRARRQPRAARGRPLPPARSAPPRLDCRGRGRRRRVLGPLRRHPRARRRATTEPIRASRARSSPRGASAA